MNEWVNGTLGSVGCGDGRVGKCLLFWYAARAGRGGASCKGGLQTGFGAGGRWVVGWLATGRIL